ncbi:disulfide bond formation protein B [Flavobacteriaceae bacterium]|nr:disulfide bond formation protein B [Flavobacteriaceae bacterium]
MEKDKNSKKHLPTFLFIASSSALVFAYIAEYYFKLIPCELCLLQRKPFIIILALSSIAIFFKLPKKLQKIITYLSLLTIIANIFLASYHVGVEKGIFSAPNSCSPAIIKTDDLVELEKIITQTTAIRCDKPVFIIGSLSMAFLNMLYCIFIIITSFAFKKKKK